MDNLIYSLMEDSQFVDIMTADILDEAFDATKARHKIKREMRVIKGEIKEAKKLMKSGETNKAKKLYSKCRSELEKLKTEANKIPKDSMIEYAHHGGVNGTMYMNIRTGGPDKYDTFSKAQTLHEINQLIDEISKSSK